MKICDNDTLSLPNPEVQLTNDPIRGFFDISNSAKLDANSIIIGSDDGDLQYSGKISKDIIPYLEYPDLQSETEIKPISTAIAVIRKEENEYIVFYASYHDPGSGSFTVKVNGDQQLTTDAIADKVTSHRYIKDDKSYIIYIIPHSISNIDGTPIEKYANLFNKTDTLSKDDLKLMIQEAGDVVVSAPVVPSIPVVPPPSSSAVSTVIAPILPELEEVTPVPTPGDDRTPSYTFSSNVPGKITSTHSFTGSKNANVGNNTIIFDTLADGTYNPKITLIDDLGNDFTLNVRQFEIKPSTTVTPPPGPTGAPLGGPPGPTGTTTTTTPPIKVKIYLNNEKIIVTDNTLGLADIDSSIGKDVFYYDEVNKRLYTDDKYNFFVNPSSQVVLDKTQHTRIEFNEDDMNEFIYFDGDQDKKMSFEYDKFEAVSYYDFDNQNFKKNVIPATTGGSRYKITYV